jgi:hypothetical protein
MKQLHLAHKELQQKGSAPRRTRADAAASSAVAIPRI